MFGFVRVMNIEIEGIAYLVFSAVKTFSHRAARLAALVHRAAVVDREIVAITAVVVFIFIG